MRRIVRFLGVAIGALLVLNGCSQSSPDTGRRDNVSDKEIQIQDTTYAEEQDTLLQIPEKLTDMRRPDMKVRVRKGSALCLETEGFQLVAVDTAVKHTREYSVTSLQEEDIAPLPQGMKNMTAATAGYRLLPSGEHFSPYAELHVAYDPERLPFGYTPEDIYTSYYDTSTMAWVRLERLFIDTVNHEIVSATTHFTDFINELLKAPEMPETQAFVPTQMSDLEAVNPLDGMPLIQPPAANNDGTANLTYPLVIPAGRAGMQPNLSLTYNSSRGSGWLGVGWDIPIPAITLDTRWGVPRYDTTYETEIYLLNGEQLVTKDVLGNVRPMPHRTNQQIKRHDLGDSVQFYARTGDTHDSIIRHDTSTTNYWWEVVDRNGVTHHYGHYPNPAFNAENPTTLKDNHGNIAKWMLAESRDLYGNTVRYYYNVRTVPDPVNEGRQIYIDSIVYTGHYDTNGLYSVVFQYSNNLTSDIPVVCNNGFKEKTDLLLCNVSLRYKGNIVTAWAFNMGKNQPESNYKNRLISITKIDTTEEAFQSVLNSWCDGGSTTVKYAGSKVEFDYYNAPGSNNLFGSNQTFNLTNSYVRGLLYSGYVYDDIDRTTALGLSHTKSWNVGGAVTAGTGSDFWQSSHSLGGNYRYGESESETLMTLVDLNGDGLADKVYVKDGAIHFCRRLPDSRDVIQYATEEMIEGATHFMVESSSSNTYGVQASLGIGASATWTNSESSISTYFADVNGDGLPDIVSNGNVLFNKLSPSGIPTFSPYEFVEPGEEEPQITTTASECGGIIFDGIVNDSIKCRRVWTPVFESNGSLSALSDWLHQYSGEEYRVKVDSTLQGNEWNYHILVYHYVWDCDYRENIPNTEAVRVWIAPDSGWASITTTVSLIEDTSEARHMARHADGISFIVQHAKNVHYDDSLYNAPEENEIFYKRGLCGNCYSYELSFDTNNIYIRKGEMLLFRLRSNSNHRFDNVVYNVDISLNGTYYSAENDFVLSDNATFQTPVKGRLVINGHYTGSSDITLMGLIGSASKSFYNGTDIYIDTVVAAGTNVHFYATSSSTGNTNWGSVSCRPHLKFYPDYADNTYSTSFNGMAHSTSITDSMEVYLPVYLQITQTNTIYQMPLCQRLFGPLYKGWGQFAYHSLDEGSSSDTLKIWTLKETDRLVAGNTNLNDSINLSNTINTQLDSIRFKEASSLEDFQNRGAFLNPLSFSSRWVPMHVDAKHGVWVSYGLQNTVGRSSMSNALHEEWYRQTPRVHDSMIASIPSVAVYDDPIPQHGDGSHCKAIVKTSEASSHSYSASVLTTAYSTSSSTNTINYDYMDLNGDRYPDIIGPDKIQYSQPWGGIGPIKNLPTCIGGNSVSEASSHGLSLGIPPVLPERTPSNNPSKAKFTLFSKGSGSITGGGNVGENSSKGAWVDINGDGLVDFVTSDGKVCLNIGYTFLPAENWNVPAVQEGVSGVTSLGTSSSLLSLWQGSLMAGVGIDLSQNQLTSVLIDINGDGLPDRVSRNLSNTHQIMNSNLFNIEVSYNKGNRQWTIPEPLPISHIGLSKSFTESIDCGLTVGFSLFFFKMSTGINGSPYSGSVNRDHIQLADANGDGLPDLVSSNQEDQISVRYNMGGKTNLLKKVTNSTGSEINLYYTPSMPDYQQPSCIWLLDSVITHDPLNPNGGDSSVTLFEYSNPSYNRYERTSFGYGTVVTQQINPTDGGVCRKVRQDYYNSNILNRGRIKREITYDGANNKYIEKEYFYDYSSYDGSEVDTCNGNAYSHNDTVVTRYFEGSMNPKLTVREIFQFDSFYNVVTYIDEGDTAYNDDGLTVNLSYYPSRGHNLIGLRMKYEVIPNGSSTVQREAHFVYNNQGKLVEQSIGGGANPPTYNFIYDTVYGNLFKGIHPSNYLNQRMEYTYTYDDTVHTYPVRIDNSYGEHSATSYDYRFGKPLTVTDPNNNTMSYAYDFSGRLIAVKSPLNTSTYPSLKNQYYPIGYYHNNFNPPGYVNTPSPTGHPYSVSMHYDDHGSLITRTAVITDGFGRVLQTKKGLTESGVAKMQVSGRTYYDSVGLAVRQGDPFTVPDTNLSSLGQFDSLPVTNYVTLTSYDVLNRVKTVRQPLGITTKYVYDISNDVDNHRRFYTQLTDPEGNITHQFTDYEGRQVQVTDANGGITKMHYDNLGQLTWSQDPEDFITHYGYDNLGRLRYRDHPDAGRTDYTYDSAGNLTQETNPLGDIFYDYTYHRLIGKRYSYMTGNNVTYTYGNNGNDRGRIVGITDGSGQLKYHYDKLGNITAETRTIALPGAGDEVYEFHMSYNYDSWGRMMDITYPDGETVDYAYTWGGDLASMNGTQSYIDSVHYNAFGQHRDIFYGNGTHATYTYDSLHRLSHLDCYEYGGGVLQNIDYQFDNTGNITSINNPVSPVGTFNGYYANSYKYDCLHRLFFSGGSNIHGSYEMNMEYSSSGRIILKNYELPSTALTDTVTMYYGYCDNYQPHAVRRIFDSKNSNFIDLRWDEAGNLGQVSFANNNTYFERGRFLFWTEENRLHTVVDEKHYSYYVYDHSGERRIKITGEISEGDVNSDIMFVGTMLSEISLYPSAYMVATNHGYTKHYYAGADRVAARIGGGGMHAIGDDNHPMRERARLLFGQCLYQIEARELHVTKPDCIQNREYDVPELHGLIEGIPRQLQVKTLIDPDGFFKAMKNEHMVHVNMDTNVYFYHGDHLGSASWITDHGGHPIQHLQYLPFGEPFVNQRAAGTTYKERYTFTGKERDEETGYGYFGARYMDHELMTIWISVDPMSDKYPNISPYAYCAWNPVKLVDPNGQDIWEINSQGKVVNHIKDKSKDAFYMVDDKGARQSSISFKYGTITGSNGEMWFSSTTSFNVNSQSAGAELFKFFADNTMIEYGLINTESNGSIVTTDHKTNKVNALKIAKELDKKGQTITSIVHNHPHNSKPSGFKKDDTHGDKFAVQQFQTSQGHLIDYYVYTPNNGKLIQFDNLRFYGSESWNAVFSTSSSRIYPTVKSHHGVGLSPR